MIEIGTIAKHFFAKFNIFSISCVYCCYGRATFTIKTKKRGTKSWFCQITISTYFYMHTLRKMCPNTELSLVRLFLYLDQKPLRIWTLFTQLQDSNLVENSFSLERDVTLMWFIAQKMKFSIKDFFSKFYQIRSLLRIWSHLLKKSLIENFIVCAVISSFCDFLNLSIAKNKFQEFHNKWYNRINDAIQ